MNREEFKAIRAKLTKGTRVRIRLDRVRYDIPTEFTASVKAHGPSFVEVGIKDVRGLRFLIFTQIKSMEVLPDAAANKQ